MQKDENMQPLALMLFGGLLELRKEMNSDKPITKVWQLKAKSFLDKIDQVI